jgi:hypothetical protein
MGLFDRFLKKSTPEKQFTSAIQNPPFHSSIAKSDLIDELDGLKYFTYADPEHLPQLKTELGKGLAEEHYFLFIESGSSK